MRCSIDAERLALEAANPVNLSYFEFVEAVSLETDVT